MSLWKIGAVVVVWLALQTSAAGAVEVAPETTKKAGVFINAAMIEKAKANAAKYPWAAEMRDKAVREAEPWMKLTDDELWDTMFGATIPRAWMVWSNGFCPSCKKSVPMYLWKVSAFEHPWKVQCPECKEFFPKNDFHAFYKSGLDEHGVFDPKLANRKLLYNSDHPDPSDPLHSFGVDDGTGYIEGQNRWRFVGYYILRGTYQQCVVEGIVRLGTAYCFTGNPAYAHKSAILLDRLADLFPTFDFKTQGWVYEKQDAEGYLTSWHECVGEIRSLAVGYDQIFDGIKNDRELVDFLSAKAKRYKLDNPKSSFADIQRNIENRILRDVIAHRIKITSNYPQTDLCIAMYKTVLEWPANKQEVLDILGGIIEKSTAVDGVSGEKGLSCYSAWATQTLVDMLARYSSAEPSFLADSFKAHPGLHKTWQFWIDTWCLQQYYPNIGDSDPFRNRRGYSGIGTWSGATGLSRLEFLYQLYKITGNPAYAQIEYMLNGNSVDALPRDIFADDPTAEQNAVKEVVDRDGTEIKTGTVNLEQWHLALLRSGKGKDARVGWLDYDSSGMHGHADCMNLGLFAKGTDLMSDFGYPPVQYGGWDSPKARWYKMTASHNTVVVDGDWQKWNEGKTTLWAPGDQFQAIRASAPYQDVPQYERTVATVGISDTDFYVFDLFRVVGKGNHAKMQHTQSASMAVSGLSLSPGEDFGHGAILRKMQTDPSAKPGWSADYKIDDRRTRAETDADVHVRITDLTAGAQASTCEAYVSPSNSSSAELWIPETIVRRQGQAPLSSAFVGVIEPYDAARTIGSTKRLPLQTQSGAAYGDANVAVEVTLADGRRDLIITADVQNPLGLKPCLASDGMLVQKNWDVALRGEMCLIRLDRAGKVERIAICKGRSVKIGATVVRLKDTTDFIEVVFEKGRPRLVTGDPKSIEAITVRGKNTDFAEREDGKQLQRSENKEY